jgi:hypothetical protein
LKKSLFISLIAGNAPALERSQTSPGHPVIRLEHPQPIERDGGNGFGEQVGETNSGNPMESVSR